ncbi:RNA polymerase sigma factor [Sanguibacter suaedae]|uniref:Sigma-70 family RNA polymerase sigma factor n=1 Tax=Sanguibacter suaedae TaxID=2795737 RepID=A0A934IFH1_9MICO|nr:sigma-70 family RNA polymerase sigma factor [Sanguibacter suaedae]MBI9116019.1 sigma-70 family RNA polymerase sigma factor [Sanguibacter suaedae]
MTHTDHPPTERDEAWFDDLFREHAGAVLRFVVRRAGSVEAEDLTADVLTTAWRRRDAVPDGHELAWLYRTAGFVVANHHRKGRPTPVETVPEPDDGAASVEHVVLDDLEVREAFATLSAKDREVLLLAAWEGLRGEALAEVLGTSRSAADTALSRARRRLREAWEAPGGATQGARPGPSAT